MAFASRKRFIYNAGKEKRQQDRPNIGTAAQFVRPAPLQGSSKSDNWSSNSVLKENANKESHSVANKTANERSVEQQANQCGRDTKRLRTNNDDSFVLPNDLVFCDEDLDFSDDLCEDFSLVELDRIELEASQNPKKPFGNPGTVPRSSNEATWAKPKQISNRPVSARPSPQQSDKSVVEISPPLKNTMNLFSGVTFNDDAEMSSLKDESVLGAVVDNSATLLKSEMEQLQESILGKEGEIKMLRDSIKQLEESASQAKVTIRKLEENIKSSESKRDIELRRQITRLETQLKFKEKEVNDVIERQRTLSETVSKVNQSKPDVLLPATLAVSSPGDGFIVSPTRLRKSQSEKRIINTALSTATHKEIVHPLPPGLENACTIVSKHLLGLYVSASTSNLPCEMEVSKLLRESVSSHLPVDDIKQITTKQRCSCDWDIVSELNSIFSSTALHRSETASKMACQLVKPLFADFVDCCHGNVLASKHVKNIHALFAALSALDILSSYLDDIQIHLLTEFEDPIQQPLDVGEDIEQDAVGSWKSSSKSIVGMLILIMTRVGAIPIAKVSFNVITKLFRSKKYAFSRLLQHVIACDILSISLDLLAENAIDNVIFIALQAIEGGDVLKLLCNGKDSCPLLQLLKIYLSSSCSDQSPYCRCSSKLKLIRLLSTVVAKYNGDHGVFLNLSCQCSRKIIKTIVIILYDEFRCEQEELISPQKQTTENVHRSILLRQGVALLAQLCLKDRCLVDNRCDVEHEYSILVHGVIIRLQNNPTVSEHEITLLQDLLAIDQYDDMEEYSQVTSQN